MVALADLAGATSLLIAILMLAAAVFVARRGPDRSINRRLVWVMFYEAIFLLTVAAGSVDRWVPAGSPLDTWLFVMGRFSIAAVLILNLFYLRFLGRMDTPIARPLRSTWGWAIIAPLLAIAASVPLLIGLDLSLPGTLLGLRTLFVIVFGPLALLAIVSVYALAIVVHAHIRKPRESPARRSSRALAWAFGTRDGLWVMLLLVVVLSIATPDPATSASTAGQAADPSTTFWGTLSDIIIEMGPALISGLFVLLLMYGVLTVQLFDIDLRIKTWTANGLWAAFVGGAFFAFAEGLEMLLSAGSLVPGIVAAGLASIVLVPLKRLARKAANALFPGVRDSPEYRMQRKRLVYEALANELAHGDPLPDDERQAILALMEKVGTPIQAPGPEAAPS